MDNLDDDGDKDSRDRMVVVACAHLDGEGGAGLWSKISPALLCHRSLHNPLVYKVLLVYMYTPSRSNFTSLHIVLLPPSTTSKLQYWQESAHAILIS